MANKVSIKPSEFVEGGAVPVDRQLTWKECRFANFDYTKKDGTVVASTIAARITYQDADGSEFIQHYSAGDPKRFQPSADAKTLVPVGDVQVLSKSSNYFLLMNALINAGFPEDKIDDDISILDGLVTFNIGVPEPKRSGLKSSEPPVEGARERILSVPSQIIKLPWEKKAATGKSAAAPAGKAPAGKGATAPVASEADVADVVAIAVGLLEKEDSATRTQVATAAIRAKKNAKAVYLPDFEAGLLANGLSLDGETITKAE